MVNNIVDLFIPLTLLIIFIPILYRLIVVLKFGKNIVRVGVSKIEYANDNFSINGSLLILSVVLLIITLFIIDSVGWLIVVPLAISIYMGRITERSDIRQININILFFSAASIIWNNKSVIAKIDKSFVILSILLFIVCIILLGFYK